MPDFSRELAHGGLVAGVDEAGRGPLAGPVIAACVLFREAPRPSLAAAIRDSKKLSEARRDAVFAQLRADESVLVAAAGASVGEIYARNILHASLLAMRRAVDRLPIAPDLVLVDGNKAPALRCAADCVIGGDDKSLSIAAASIIAKVLRDRIMTRLAARYPVYGWAQNAGYPTLHHRDALRAHGPTRHHRMGFGPLKGLAGDV